LRRLDRPPHHPRTSGTPAVRISPRLPTDQIGAETDAKLSSPSADMSTAALLMALRQVFMLLFDLMKASVT
jgi:hypothetical protein